MIIHITSWYPHRYCWNDPNAAWGKKITVMRHIIQHTVQHYLSYLEQNGMLVNGSSFREDHLDKLRLPNNEEVFTTFNESFPLPFLPVIPDVMIQYRCNTI